MEDGNVTYGIIVPILHVLPVGLMKWFNSTGPCICIVLTGLVRKTYELSVRREGVELEPVSMNWVLVVLASSPAFGSRLLSMFHSIIEYNRSL